MTDNGGVVRSITADQMREVDRIAMEISGPNLFQMMEHAGRSLAALRGRVRASYPRDDDDDTRASEDRLRPATCGELILADLGIPDAVYRQLGLSIQSPFDHRFAVPLHWSEEAAHAHRS